MPGNKVTHTRACSGIVRIIISVILRTGSVQIKFEIVLDSVIMQFQNCIAFRCDCNLQILISFPQTESGIMAFVADSRNIVFSAVIHKCIGYVFSYCAAISHIGSFYLISISFQVLGPENYCITRILVWQPFRVNCCFFVKRPAEYKLGFFRTIWI